jgi:hypothetical protein
MGASKQYCLKANSYNVPECPNSVIRCSKIAGTDAETFGYYCKSGKNIVADKNWFCPSDNIR